MYENMPYLSLNMFGRKHLILYSQNLISSSYVRSPRCLEDTSDGTSEAGLLVTDVTTWPKINFIRQNLFLFIIRMLLFH